MQHHLQGFDSSSTSLIGATLLRLVLSSFWLSHWWFKVGYRGMSATITFFALQGLPAWLAWFAVSFEILVVVCLILGVYVSVLCVLSLPILLASAWIYRKNGFYFSNGGIEFPLLWACTQIAQALLGPGTFRVSIPGWLS